MGYRLVRVQLQESAKRRTLQIMADRLDHAPVTVEDCSQISRHISALLDVKDPIDGAYQLEVSSPGIDRPLMTLEDFADYIGHEAKVEMQLPIDGRRRFNGTLLAVEDNTVRLRMVEGKDVTLDFNAMRSAQLLLTDALLAAHEQQAVVNQ